MQLPALVDPRLATVEFHPARSETHVGTYPTFPRFSGHAGWRWQPGMFVLPPSGGIGRTDDRCLPEIESCPDGQR